MKTGCATRGIAKIPIKHTREGVAIFIRIWGNKPLDEINNEDFEKINKEYTIERAYSASFDNQVVNALNLFFQNPQQRNLNLQLIYRLKRPETLPNVLSKEEVKTILEAHKNIKHKAMPDLCLRLKKE